MARNKAYKQLSVPISKESKLGIDNAAKSADLSTTKAVELLGDALRLNILDLNAIKSEVEMAKAIALIEAAKAK